MDITGIILGCALVALSLVVVKLVSVTAERDLACNTKDALEKQLGKVTHQKKSSEVRLGKIGENLAPFTEAWPWDPNNFRFLGSPIDGIQFTEEEILFVEIKTGKSRLSRYQAKCRDLVNEGKVRFVTFRIDEDGVDIK